MSNQINRPLPSNDDKTVFKKLSSDTYFVNSPCFLTVPHRTIRLKERFLKSEGSHFDAVQLLNVHFENGFIYLQLEDLKTCRIYVISHIIGENYPCIWWLLNWDYFETEMIKRIKRSYCDTSLLEFNF
jgi:hypothetical protein